MFAARPTLVENQFVWFRHMKWLIVHFSFGQSELRRDPVRDRMFREQRPNRAWLHRRAATRKDAGGPLDQDVPFAVFAAFDARVKSGLLAPAGNGITAPLNEFRHSLRLLANRQHFDHFLDQPRLHRGAKRHGPMR